MGMTMTQKILARHAGLDSVEAGQLISAKLDLVLGNDITTPVAVNEFNKAGFDGVFDKDRIAIVLDHFVPNKDIKAAEQSKQCREFAYGALGAFSTGVGSTDMAAGMATGTAWFKVPAAIKFELKGKLPKNCSGKDVILTIIGMIGVDGAL